MSVTDLLAPWQTLDESLGLGAPIRDEEHYKALLAFVDECRLLGRPFGPQ